ncbi:MAG: Uma2 family endonuclease [Clostridiales bacterium]|nr:Uma2 family endonuclease [Clostridiales bacterium]
MGLPKEELYTTDYIYDLPEGRRAELIDGRVYDMAPPSTLHQRISVRLSTEIVHYISRNGGSCEAFSAPFAVFLNEDDRTYVEPDISVICDPKKLNSKGCSGAPDWIVEIVSPASIQMDYMTKLFKYRTAGVREYWIVDPIKHRIVVYDFDHNKTEEYTFSDTVKVGIYDDLAIDFSQLLPFL